MTERSPVLISETPPNQRSSSRAQARDLTQSPLISQVFLCDPIPSRGGPSSSTRLGMTEWHVGAHSIAQSGNVRVANESRAHLSLLDLTFFHARHFEIEY